MEVELHSSSSFGAVLADETERLTLAYVPVIKALSGESIERRPF